MCPGSSPKASRSVPQLQLGRLIVSASHSPEHSPSRESEVKQLREENVRLRRRQQSLERRLRELTPAEFHRQYEEEIAQRVARHARETAANVMKHEQELTRVVSRYEEQLEALNGGRLAEVEGTLVSLQRALEAERRRAEAAEAERLTAESDAARHRRRARKWKSRSSEEPSTPLCLSARPQSSPEPGNPHQQAMRVLVDTPFGAARPGASHLLSVVGARLCLSAFAAFHAWASLLVQVRHRRALEAFSSESTLTSTHALAQARSEARALRVRGRRVARSHVDARTRLHVAAPFSAWARWAAVCARATALQVPTVGAELPPHPARRLGGSDASRSAALRLGQADGHCTLHVALRTWTQAVALSRHARVLREQLDQATSHSMRALSQARAELRVVRGRGRSLGVAAGDRRAALCVTKTFGAWARETARERAAKDGGGTIAVKELQEQLARVKSEASGARASSLASVRREAQSAALARRFELGLRRGEQVLVFHVIWKAWEKEVWASRQQAALRKVREQAKREEQAAVARVRGEGKSVLHKAWQAQAEADRQASAWERRCATAGQVDPLDLSLETTEVLRERTPGMQPTPRPRTAREIEQRLAEAEAEATVRIKTGRRTSTGLGRPGVSRSGLTGEVPAHSKPEVVGEAEVLRITDDDPEAQGGVPLASPSRVAKERRDQRNLNALAAVVSRQESCLLAALLGAWQRTAAQARSEKMRKDAAQAQELAQDAREMRKGLFAAALEQQSKYWLADAFAKWRHHALEVQLRRARADAPDSGQRLENPSPLF